MDRVKHILTILIFSAVCLLTATYSFLGDWENNLKTDGLNVKGVRGERDESYFSIINYFMLKDTRPVLHLDAEELVSNNTDQKIIFTYPEGMAYTANQTPVMYSAMNGLFLKDKEKLFLENNVFMNTDTSQLQADKVKYTVQIDEAISTGNVKTKTISRKNGDQIFIDSDRAKSWPKSNKSNFHGNVKGKIIRKRVYEEKIYFDSDSLFLDGNASKIKMLGNVFVKKQGLEARSRNGEIFLDNYNKKLKYFVLYDDVKVKEKIKTKDNKIIIRRSYSEKFEGIISEDKFILTGYPKVIQEKDVITGNRIVIRENNEVVEVEDADTNLIIK